MNQQKDKIYSNPNTQIEKFRFDNKVAGVFDDMIKRSVPGYERIINTIGDLANIYVKPSTNIYDLGCSLGSATISVRRNVHHQSCKIVAVDNSPSMIERCQEHINAYVSDIDVELVCSNIQEIDINNASMVILNFTLQFLCPTERDELIDKIYQGLNKGGILIISEKLRFEDPHIQQLLDEQHLDFKRANGYSELEISQKRTALEDVMRPDTLQIHQQRLSNSGFNHVNLWYQCFNFASMVAIK
ncbi:MAG: carboxy-S-adenosyl-L-methionine synthase CmoA [Parashewanella sp.]